MPRITISYRRNDSEDITGRIYDRLRAHYGPDAVFLDIDSVPPGANFRRYIGSVIQETDCLLVVVSPRWLGPRDDAPNRILDRNDPVRVEVAAALRHGIAVIPLFVGHATMPGPEALPHDLSEFCNINGVEISSGRDFEHHLDRLTRWLDTAMDQPKADRLEGEKLQVHPAKRNTQHTEQAKLEKAKSERVASAIKTGLRPARRDAATWIAASILAALVAVPVLILWHPWQHPGISATVASRVGPSLETSTTLRGTCAQEDREAAVVSEVLPKPPFLRSRLPQRPVFADVKVTVVPKGSSSIEGQLLSAKIYKSSGNEAVDRSAVEAAQKQVYTPKLVNCRPMMGSLIIYYVMSVPTIGG